MKLGADNIPPQRRFGVEDYLEQPFGSDRSGLKHLACGGENHPSLYLVYSVDAAGLTVYKSLAGNQHGIKLKTVQTELPYNCVGPGRV